MAEMIEQEAETLMNICRLILDHEKTFNEVKDDMERVTKRLYVLLNEKKNRLKNLMANLE